MKKYALFLLLGILILSSLACTLESTGTVGAKPHPELKPEMVVIADDSPYVGTYDATRSGYENHDTGTFTEAELSEARCGTKFATKIVLGAKAGYHWTYYASHMLKEGWFLEKD
ncbi:MAG TPA: hypothetical protein VF837_05445 [Patescibacteria group bacterium]